MEPTQVQHAYPLGHDPAELNRVSAQASICDPFTRLVFHSSGLVSGMRVLDVAGTIKLQLEVRT